MRISGGNQTGGVVLLAMAVVCTALGISILFPLFQGRHQTSTASKSSPATAASPDYSEFYPDSQQHDSPRTVSRLRSQNQRVTRRELQSEFVAEVVHQPQHSRSSRNDATGRKTSTQYFAGAGSDSVTRLRGPAVWGTSGVTAETVPEPDDLPRAAVDRRPVRQDASDGTYGSDDILFSELTAANTERIQHPELGHRSQVASRPVQPTTSQDAIQTQSEAHRTVSKAAPTFAPAQVPGGSVYAPVTVNLDTSMLSDQIRHLERRLDSVATAPVAPPQAVRQPVVQQVPPRRSRNARSRFEREHKEAERAKELARIGDGFERLVQSVKVMQNTTSESLREVAAQASRAESATRVLQRHQRELELRDQKQQLEMQVRLLEATRLAEANALAQRGRGEYRTSSSNSAPTRISQPLPAEALQRASRGSTHDSQPVPRKLNSSQNRNVPLPEVLIDESNRQSGSSGSSASMSTRILPPGSGSTPRKVQMRAPAADPDEAVKKAEPDGDFLSFPAPVSQASQPLKSVPKTGSPTREATSNVRSVGFENTYKFRMDVDESGQDIVVEDSGRVCPRCGKVHAAGHQHHRIQPRTPSLVHASATELTKQSKVTQTAMAEKGPHVQASAPLTVAGSVEPPARDLAQAPKRNLRRDTRNAGRGINRKIGHSAERTQKGKPAPEGGNTSFLKLKMGTLTQQPDEPGILHRMSSTIRQLGRNMQ